MSLHTCSPACLSAIRAYADGISSVEAATRVNHSAAWLLKRLRQHGVAIRSQGPQGLRKPAAWMPEAARRYEAGETLKQIGASMGCNYEYVRQVLIRLGVPRRTAGRPKNRHVCDDICRAVLAAPQPVRWATVAAQLSGVTMRRVIRAGKAHDVRSDNRTRHWCNERCRVLERLLAEDRLTLNAVAAQAGIKVQGLTQNYPGYHPEWNWRRKRAELRPIGVAETSGDETVAGRVGQ